MTCSGSTVTSNPLLSASRSDPDGKDLLHAEVSFDTMQVTV